MAKVMNSKSKSKNIGKIKINYQLVTENKGFTLIELIVVMSIIAVLSTLSLFAIQGARRSSRDAKRKADLGQIASALEMYKADCNSYPSSLPGIGSSLQSNCLGSTVTYLQTLPGDPSGGSYYYSRPTEVTFILCSTLEDSTAVAPSGCPVGGTACAGQPCRYKVTNP